MYSQAFKSFTEKLAPAGLSIAQFDLLASLIAAEPHQLKQSELASRLLVTKGNVSGMLSRMADLGMVTRVDDPSDRRSKRIAITEQGRELYQKGRAAQKVLIDQLFGELKPEKLEMFGEVVDHLCERM